MRMPQFVIKGVEGEEFRAGLINKNNVFDDGNLFIDFSFKICLGFN